MPPLSGLVGMYGREIIRAAQIAVEEVNASGGLLGEELHLVVEDDGSLPEPSVSAALRLVEEHRCHALVGNLLSNSRIAVAEYVAAPLRIPYLNFSFYEGSIASRYFFSFSALPNQQIEQALPSMVERFGAKVFFAGNNYEWPRGSIDAGKRVVARLGGTVLGERYLSLGVSDDEVDLLLEELRLSGADLFVPYFAGWDQIKVLEALAGAGLKDRVTVFTGHFDEVLAPHLAPAARSAVYCANSYFMSVDTPQNKAFQRRLEALDDVDALYPRGNGVMTNFGEGAYVCVRAFAEAVLRAGSVEAEALVNALRTVSVKAPQGPVAIDPRTHHASINAYLSRCDENGVLQVVESYGAIEPAIPERFIESFAMAKLDTIPAGMAQDLGGGEIAIDGTELCFEAVLAHMNTGVMTLSPSGLIRYVNDEACALLGYRRCDLLGHSIQRVMPPHLRHAQSRRLLETAGSAACAYDDVVGYRRDGTFLPLSVSVSRGPVGDAYGYILVLQDRSRIKQIEDDLTWRANHDALTGLANRARLLELLDNALHRAEAGASEVAVLFVDLDGFKQINDTHGHELGDELLKQVAQRLLATARPGDLVARLAGDEFVLVCEHVRDPNEIHALADELGASIRRPFPICSPAVHVSVSIGVAMGHGATWRGEDLLRAADTAMYSVKASGRDGWQLFDQMRHLERSRRAMIVAGLPEAIDNEELYTVYQPIVCPSEGRLRGVEVLLRWKSAHGEVSPAEFIPVAEMNNLITSIGYWVFERACRLERSLWDRGADAPVYVTVNVSARQLLDRSIVDTFGDILQRTGARASNIMLELTETALMTEASVHLDRLSRLQQLGLRLAVDDFGTGYSSLARLKQLRAHTIKIDRAFVRDLHQEPGNQAIVEGIVHIGQSMRMSLVAEGVESEEELQFLRGLRVDAVQGYLFYRPLDEAQFSALLKQGCVSLRTTGMPAETRSRQAG